MDIQDLRETAEYYDPGFWIGEYVDYTRNHPSDPYGWRNLARCLRELGRKEEAIHCRAVARRLMKGGR